MSENKPIGLYVFSCTLAVSVLLRTGGAVYPNGVDLFMAVVFAILAWGLAELLMYFTADFLYDALTQVGSTYSEATNQNKSEPRSTEAAPQAGSKKFGLYTDENKRVYFGGSMVRLSDAEWDEFLEGSWYQDGGGGVSTSLLAKLVKIKVIDPDTKKPTQEIVNTLAK